MGLLDAQADRDSRLAALAAVAAAQADFARHGRGDRGTAQHRPSDHDRLNGLLAHCAAPGGRGTPQRDDRTDRTDTPASGRPVPAVNPRPHGPWHETIRERTDRRTASTGQQQPRDATVRGVASTAPSTAGMLRRRAAASRDNDVSAGDRDHVLAEDAAAFESLVGQRDVRQRVDAVHDRAQRAGPDVADHRYWSRSPRSHCSPNPLVRAVVDQQTSRPLLAVQLLSPLGRPDAANCKSCGCRVPAT